MPASEWAFHGGGLLYKAGAWKGDSDNADRLHAYVQPTVEGVRVTAAAPLPVREPVRGAPLSQGTFAATTASGTLVAANSSRRIIEIANPATVNLWLRFGAVAAAVGTGVFVPPGAIAFWMTTVEVRCILASGSGVSVGYVEWD